jgi:putative membrane protein
LIGNMKKFQDDKNQKTQKYFRVINEVPTLLIIVLVFLVILRP